MWKGKRAIPCRVQANADPKIFICARLRDMHSFVVLYRSV